MNIWNTLALSTLLGTALLPTVTFGESCKAIDLRDPVLAPVRSQNAWNDKGELSGSSACHAFTTANLIAQEVGKPISAEYIYLYKVNDDRFAPFHYDDYTPPSEDYAHIADDILKSELGGFVYEDIKKMLTYKACPLSSMQKFAHDQMTNFCGMSTHKDPTNGDGWYPCVTISSCPILDNSDQSGLYKDILDSLRKSGDDFSITGLQALYNEAKSKKFTIRDLNRLLDQICSRKIAVKNIHPVVWSIDKDHDPHISDGTWVLKDDPSDLTLQVDRLIDRGKFVAYSYRGHVVTVVGRTQNCEYIIQDTIPRTEWLQRRGPQGFGQLESDVKWLAGVRFEGEHFQYWKKDLFTDFAESITYIEKGGLKN